PASTCSPSRLSQAPTVASTTDSPSTGTRTSTDMRWLHLQDFGDDAPLLGGMCVGPPFSRAGSVRAADVAQLAVAQQFAQARPKEGPGAHVARLFLQPDHFPDAVVTLQQVDQRF